MDMNDVKTGAEIVKDSSEALKNFQEIIGMAFLSSYKKTMKAILPPEAKSTLNAHLPTICHRLHSDGISRYLHWLVEPD